MVKFNSTSPSTSTAVSRPSTSTARNIKLSRDVLDDESYLPNMFVVTSLRTDSDSCESECDNDITESAVSNSEVTESDSASNDALTDFSSGSDGESTDNLTDFSSGCGNNYILDDSSEDPSPTSPMSRQNIKKRKLASTPTPQKKRCTARPLQSPLVPDNETSPQLSPSAQPSPSAPGYESPPNSPLPPPPSPLQSPPSPATDYESLPNSPLPPPPLPHSSPNPAPHVPALWTRVYPPEPPVDVRPKFKVRNPGPRHTQGCKTPTDFFLLFLNTAIWQAMVNATNSFAHYTIDVKMQTGTMKQSSRCQRWTDVTVCEMKKFIGLLLNMGLMPIKKLPRYWSTKDCFFHPFYSRVMSVNRFKEIMSMFQVCESHHKIPRLGEPCDPWVKISSFINNLNDSFRRYFVPFQNVCIDESMIGMKNKTVFLQYMPNKRHARYGIKKFELCDSQTGYVLQSLLYSGADFNKGNDPFTQFVVSELMSKVGLLNKRYHLFTDNFYTKIPLANYLCSNKTYLTGTINKRSRMLSSTVKTAELQSGESIYFRRGQVLLVKYLDKKRPVFLITTAVHAEDISVVSASGREAVKPAVIDRYNKFMGGVDCKDKSLYHLTCSRMTKKYWKKIVYNFIDMAIFNAHILFNFHCNRRMDRDDFLSEIIHTFCLPPQLGVVTPATNPPLAPEHALQNLPHKNKRKCVVCGSRTGSWCVGCNVGVHHKCFRDLQHYLRPERRGRPSH